MELSWDVVISNASVLKNKPETQNGFDQNMDSITLNINPLYIPYLRNDIMYQPVVQVKHIWVIHESFLLPFPDPLYPVH